MRIVVGEWFHLHVSVDGDATLMSLKCRKKCRDIETGKPEVRVFVKDNRVVARSAGAKERLLRGVMLIGSGLPISNSR